MLSIAHIVNVFRPPPSSDLARALPVTLASMAMARKVASGELRVTQASAQFSEDRDIVPDWMVKTTDLSRSVCDLHDFEIPRPLPLLRDILSRLGECGGHDLAVYTNSDIGLSPSFYLLISRLYERGFDGMVINRRSIPADFELEDLPLMAAELGEPHDGWDCFVFPMKRLGDLDVGNVCVGAAGSGIVLLWTVLANSENPKVFRKLHATFHLGNSMPWLQPAFDDYAEFNRAEFRAASRRMLEVNPGLRDVPTIRWLASMTRDPGEFGLEAPADHRQNE